MKKKIPDNIWQRSKTNLHENYLYPYIKCNIFPGYKLTTASTSIKVSNDFAPYSCYRWGEKMFFLIYNVCICLANSVYLSTINSVIEDDYQYSVSGISLLFQFCPIKVVYCQNHPTMMTPITKKKCMQRVKNFLPKSKAVYFKIDMLWMAF